MQVNTREVRVHELEVQAPRCWFFHCCLLITVLTQDKGHQAPALSTHERKLQAHSLFIFSTRIVSKRVSQPSEFNIRNKQECHNATKTYQVLHLPISTGPIMEVVAGFTLHLCVEQNGENPQISEGLTTQPSSTKTRWQQREAGVHPTNLDAASLPIASLPAPKLQAAAPLSASEVSECIARNIQSVKIWILVIILAPCWQFYQATAKTESWSDHSQLELSGPAAVTFCCSSFLTLSFSMETWR